MFLSWYQQLPFLIDPIAFRVGFFAVRWYSLSYVVGFCVIWLLLEWRIVYDIKKNAQISNFQFPTCLAGRRVSKKSSKLKSQISNLLVDFLIAAMIGAIVGGRLGYVLFYDFSYFLHNPLAIAWPFDAAGQYRGILGMSYFGGALGALGASYFLARNKKQDFFAWADFIVPAIPAGYFFGRIGNFLNGELWGRVTKMPWGIQIPTEQVGILRHPSQLYEALTEGLFLFVLLWSLRNKKSLQGKLLWIYLGLYSLVRFSLEFFRQPDTGDKLLLNVFTTGQMLSTGFLMIVIVCLLWQIKK